MNSHSGRCQKNVIFKQSFLNPVSLESIPPSEDVNGFLLFFFFKCMPSCVK